MHLAEAIRARLAHRGWPIARDPARLVGYVLAVDAIAVVWSLIALLTLRPTTYGWGVTGLMVLLAFAFEEGSSRVARMRFRMSSDLKRDMTSVWSVSAAVALAPGYAVLLHVAVISYLWFRQERPAGEIFYRKFTSGCTAVVGCLAAGLVMRSGAPLWADLPWLLSGSIAVFVVIVVHTCVNRGLVTVALVMLGARGKALLGTMDDNVVEFATLCLGGLVALAALERQPWLCLLVLPPMIALQRGALVHELETAATTDSKTGLLNAVAWEHLAQRELARAEREHYSVGLLIIDIDRFKLVNDRYGHLAGDSVLRGVGRSLSTAMREYDTVGRFGGEEFVAVLPDADEATAMVVAERVRARVNSMRVSQMIDGIEPGEDDVLAVSVGVACMPLNGTELPELLLAADRALYQAKAGGRNRVCFASPGTSDDVAHSIHI